MIEHRSRWFLAVCLFVGMFSIAQAEEAADTATYYRVPTVTDHLNISYPRSSEAAAISASAASAVTFAEGEYTVWVLSGDVRLTQGTDTFQADSAALWVGPTTSDEKRSVLVYLAGGVKIAFVTPKTTSRVQSKDWSGRLCTTADVQVKTPKTETLEKVPQQNPLYRAAREHLFHGAELLLTQVSTSDSAGSSVSLSGSPSNPKAGVVVPGGTFYDRQSTPETPRETITNARSVGQPRAFQGSLKESQKRIQLNARNTTLPQASITQDPQTKKNVLICDGGLNLVIEGVSDMLAGHTDLLSGDGEKMKVGTIDIVADSLVIWTTMELDVFKGGSGKMDLAQGAPFEIYLEGNIIFREGEQQIEADRMYFDVQTGRGIVREAEVFASIPNFEGLIRLRAEEIRMPEKGMLVANNAFVTTSRIGSPSYRFQLGQLMVRDQKQPKMDPKTGQPILDPRTGEPVMEGPKDVTGRDAVVKVGEVPIFYLPYFAAPLENPSNIINKVSLRNDSIFGFQPIIGVDAYRLFGFENPPEGTDWDINALYYTKRGPGIGSRFSFDRYVNGFAGMRNFGHREGFFQFDGIYDTGTDNLGYTRYDLTPETKWRYQFIGKRMADFGNNMQFRTQLGLISDRNYQQEYFQNSWYTEPDRATQFELRQQIENRSWALWADVRVNDFHTQTQRLPQAEFYWLGQPLLDDLLTWSSYSQVGYTHLYPDTRPEDAADVALWNLLPWEKNRRAARASTRHEISYPFQAGPVKLVPFALGELAYWLEDPLGHTLAKGPRR